MYVNVSEEELGVMFMCAHVYDAAAFRFYAEGPVWKFVAVSPISYSGRHVTTGTLHSTGIYDHFPAQIAFQTVFVASRLINNSPLVA